MLFWLNSLESASSRVVTHRHAFSAWFFQLPFLPIEPLGELQSHFLLEHWWNFQSHLLAVLDSDTEDETCSPEKSPEKPTEFQVQTCHECGSRFKSQQEMLNHFSKTPLKSHKSSFGRARFRSNQKLDKFRDSLSSGLRATQKVISEWTITWNCAREKIMARNWSKTTSQLSKGHQGLGFNYTFSNKKRKS